MSNPGPDRPERCIDAFGISALAELIREEERSHGSRFVAAILLE